MISLVALAIWRVRVAPKKSRYWTVDRPIEILYCGYSLQHSSCSIRQNMTC